MDTVSVGCDYGLVKSGIVLLNDRLEIESQNLIRVKSKGAERLYDIELAFNSIVQPYMPTDLQVFVEGYAYGAKYQREALAELGGVMRRYLYLSGLTFWVVPPTSLKLFVTGTGKATKNYMKKCTKDKWQQIFKSDDVCDAYGLSRLGMCIIKADSGEDYSHLPDNERTVITDILTNKHYYQNANTAGKKKTK